MASSVAAPFEVSPFTVGRSPSARRKTAGLPAPSVAREALRRVLPSRGGERRGPCGDRWAGARFQTGRGEASGYPVSRARTRD